MLVAASILVNAVLFALLLRIAWRDFQTQRIANGDVLALGLLGIAGLTLGAVADNSWWSWTVGAIAGVAMFVALLPFWLLRKLGAGDVKLLAAAPLVTGGDYLFAFALLLLLFAALTAFLVKNPILLPAPAFRHYLEHLERKGVVPFGVPISASLTGVLCLASLASKNL